MAWLGEKTNAYRVLVGKTKRKGPLGRPRRKWEDNIEMDLNQIGWEDVDWMNLTQNRQKGGSSVNTVMNPRVPESVWNF